MSLAVRLQVLGLPVEIKYTIRWAVPPIGMYIASAACSAVSFTHYLFRLDIKATFCRVSSGTRWPNMLCNDGWFSRIYLQKLTSSVVKCT